MVAKILAAYMSGIKRCYRAELVKDPVLTGKLVLAFEVNETGRVVTPTASGINATLAACVTSMMSSWRFPVPKDPSGDPVSAHFKVPLHMQPD